jgi:hypothetical protein
LTPETHFRRTFGIMSDSRSACALTISKYALPYETRSSCADGG